MLVNIGLPDGNGIELIAWLHVHCPSATSLVVSAWGDEEIVIAALRAGATGYLFKERDVDELRYALQCVQRGGAPIDPCRNQCHVWRVMERERELPRVAGARTIRRR